MAISLRLGGKKNDRRKNRRQDLRFLFMALLQAMGKMGISGDSRSGFGDTHIGNKSSP